MSTIITDIVSGIKSELIAVVGPTYRELPYVVDIEKNSSNNNDNGYGVRALVGNQVSGTVKSVTITQSFEVVLTKSFRESSISDDNLRVAENTLKDLMNDVYASLVNNKAGTPANVMNVNDLQLQQTEVVSESKFVAQRATMDITYRYSLI